MPSSKRIRAERKRQLEKASEGCRKDFFVKHTPNDNNKAKTIPTKITTVAIRTVMMTVLRTIMQMIYILVPNPYRIKVTGHNHCLMLIS